MPQPYKGHRKQVSIRMPMSLYYRLVTAAKREGIHINDAYNYCLEQGLVVLEERSGRERTRKDRKGSDWASLIRGDVQRDRGGTRAGRSF